jgi:hypothetical protein
MRASPGGLFKPPKVERAGHRGRLIGRREPDYPATHDDGGERGPARQWLTAETGSRSCSVSRRVRNTGAVLYKSTGLSRSTFPVGKGKNPDGKTSPLGSRQVRTRSETWVLAPATMAPPIRGVSNRRSFWTVTAKSLPAPVSSRTEPCQPCGQVIEADLGESSWSSPGRLTRLHFSTARQDQLAAAVIIVKLSVNAGRRRVGFLASEVGVAGQSIEASQGIGLADPVRSRCRDQRSAGHLLERLGGAVPSRGAFRLIPRSGLRRACSTEPAKQRERRLSH